MVYINIEVNGHLIILHCHRNTKEGEYFRLVIDSKTKMLVEKPEYSDMDVSTAYSHIYLLLKNNKSLPTETVAAWG